ncbi:MAG: hypothetical protein JW760_14180 [Spirochaetales bacterium]|nr:hypothetical protein [Spirochaetales bacterium]
MGKISNEGRHYYFEKLKQYKESIEQIEKREKNLLLIIQKDENGAEYKRVTLADESLNLVSYYLLMNNLSLTLLGIKNEAYLNDARKACYKSLIYLEEVVSNYIDVPFSDYEEKLEKIAGYGQKERWAMVRKLGYSIQAVKDGFGENSKWKWSFVELEGRLATVAKNLLDLKNLVKGLDPRAESYEERYDHLTMVKKLLQQSADRYREKYELSTLRLDDFKLAINYLGALRRLHLMLGEAEEGEIVKKKIDIWKAKMDADQKNMEKSVRK